VAKSRAQRKAEKRRRQQAQQQRQPGRPGEQASAAPPASPANRTEPSESGEQAEFEAVVETGARTEDYGEQTVEHDQAGSPVPGVLPEPIEPEAPAPSTADVGIPADDGADVEAPPVDETREQRRARKEREKEQRRKARAKEQKRGAAGVEAPEKKRGPVLGFLASCWAELKKVQWPDRDTLVQASAVTIIFVFVAAAYLGALDAIFNFVVKEILL
jgi:preprotein translocase SecE subunit